MTVWYRFGNVIGRETCPYCFEQFRLREGPFRCASPPSLCRPERDAVLAENWRQSTPVGRVLEPGRGLKRRSQCGQCGQWSHKRLCPSCHMELPFTMGKFRNLIFAIIGAKEVGKSHYLAVLIEQIRKHVGPATDMLLEPLNDQTIQRYRRLFYEPVYQRGVAIRATQSALVDQNVQIPLVYALTLSGKSAFGARKIRGVVTLVFFDTAGEDLDSENTMATVNKYIYRSDGIILLLDPLQLPAVRDRLRHAIHLPSKNTESSEIISRMTRLILAGRGLQPDAMLEVPLAIAFSKFDAVESLVDEQFQLLTDSCHEGGYDQRDFDAVNAEMQSLLGDWEGGQGITHQVTTRYRNYGFFGLSALGCHPGIDNKIPRVLPRRVEDPFLWLLNRHRLLPTVDAAQRSVS